MDDNQRAFLEVEASMGNRAQSAFDNFFEPFFEKKTAELFQAFKELSTTKPDELMAVKMMTNSLESLRDEIQGIINTGKLASKEINDEEEEK